MLIATKAEDNKVGVAEAYESLTKMAIRSSPEKYFQVRAHLSPAERDELVAFLEQHIDVFAWDLYEALGIDLDFICHQLNVNLEARPKKQLPWRSSDEHSNTV